MKKPIIIILCFQVFLIFFVLVEITGTDNKSKSEKAINTLYKIHYIPLHKRRKRNKSAVVKNKKKRKIRPELLKIKFLKLQYR